MPHFIKTGFWEKLSRAPKEYLNLDNLIQSIGGGGTSYKKYVALIAQVFDEEPTAVVLENTLGGTPVWSRSDVGDYRCTLAGAFPENKTACLVTLSSNGDGNTKAYFSVYDFPNECRLYVDIDGIPTDMNNFYHDTTVEIRVYP